MCLVKIRKRRAGISPGCPQAWHQEKSHEFGKSNLNEKKFTKKHVFPKDVAGHSFRTCISTLNDVLWNVH